MFLAPHIHPAGEGVSSFLDGRYVYQWAGPDWRLCPLAPPPKLLHSPRASGEMRQGAGLPVLPHFRYITRAWARGACSGKQKAGQVSWWWGMTSKMLSVL